MKQGDNIILIKEDVQEMWLLKKIKISNLTYVILAPEDIYINRGTYVPELELLLYDESTDSLHEITTKRERSLVIKQFCAFEENTHIDE